MFVDTEDAPACKCELGTALVDVAVAMGVEVEVVDGANKC